MVDAEERRIANKLDEEFDKQDRDILSKLGKDIVNYIKDDDVSYRNGKVEGKPDSFGLRLRKHLMAGGKPSEFFKANIKKFKGYIADELLPYFYASVDAVKDWQTDWTSYYRRSYRAGNRYELCLSRFPDIISEYRRLTHYGSDAYSLYTRELPEKLEIYFRRRGLFPLSEYYIAARLDEGDTKLEELITETFYGDTGDVNYRLIRGIFMSHSEKLFEVLGKTLVAARLSEGLRQAICENMDFGTREGFLYMLKVIEENDLVRFSSVRRALAVFTGINAVDPKDETRIAKKQMKLIVQSVTEEGAVSKMLSSEDSMDIYTALWSIGLKDINESIAKAEELSYSGSRHQRLTACYFLVNAGMNSLLNEYSKTMVRDFKDDDEMLALVMPVFMAGIDQKVYNTIYPDGSRYNYVNRRKRVYADYGTYFESMEECREFLQILYSILDRIPKKGIVFEESVFPWNKATLTRSSVALRIGFVASATKDENEILKAAGLLKELSGDYGSRSNIMELLLREPINEEMLMIITESVADPQDITRDIAFKLMEQEMQDDRSKAPKGVAAPAGKLPEKCYEILEGMLRLKKADVRANVLKLLSSRGPEEKLEMLQRLLSDGKEEKVTAGLDIILQLKKEQDIIFKDAAETISCIKKPTTKEQILIDEILGGATAEEKAKGSFYDINAEYTPVVDPSFMEEALNVFAAMFPDSEIPNLMQNDGELKKSGKGSKTKKSDVKKELEFIQKLDALIEEHKNDEYDSWDGKSLLGNGLYATLLKGDKEMPFAKLWDSFIAENELSDGQVFSLLLVFSKYNYRETISGYAEYFDPILSKMFGPVFDVKDMLKVKHMQQIWAILNYYSRKRELRKTNLKYIAAVVCSFLNKTEDSTEYSYKVDNIINSWERERADKTKPMRRSILDHYVMREVISGIRDDDRSFPIHLAFKKGIVARHEKNGSFTVAKYADSKRAENGKGPHPMDYIGAAACGIISKDFMYKAILDKDVINETVETVSDIEKYIRESGKSISTRGYHYSSYRRNEMVRELLKISVQDLENKELSEIQKKKLDLADECYKNISSMIMENELVRGDTPTDYSSCSVELSRVYGLNYLVRILSALGAETLDRTSYFYSYANRDISKRESMSHLLSVCIPDESEGDAKEQAGKLAELLKKTDIKEPRLIEAGLYSPEWLPIIGEYLGWDGFMSGCYYFMAHMNEKFDDKRAAVIAKYTPLTEEELNVGAFDINWFNEVYEILGKKRFDEIYKAAKYISDGAKHTRARKYADAARGEMDPVKTAEEIEKKRNKDLLMAYALIPCKEEEKKVRYSFIQKYLKESKQFGAQRRASEKAAAEMAVKNLAAASGYSDETRFILKMEREISSELAGFFEPHQVDEYLVWLEADNDGKISLAVKKGEKVLKSVPAGIKKKDYVVDITEAKKTFTEQYRRTRVMMEEAMESETEFYVSEIFDMAEDKVIGGMIRNILFKQGDFFGFPEDMKEAGLKMDSAVIVAHPYHIFTAGRWHEFQKLCFDKEIRQPFKQIFRELYVKTDEEKKLSESMRYAGNQINPKMTVALLRGRRWIADEENGLQKVYYRENIIATIYALADWFSPSDIEAPTLEWVAFYDRKTFEKKPINEIPDILFSEVMRDVDLAVSVAHAGDVDPEMSHSTIEMRRAIAEFVVPMLKLKNVTFTDSHALIKGERGNYNIHLGSGVIHQEGGPMINVLPVHSQHRGRIFLPFVDDDPKTAEIMSKIMFFAEDKKIKDPFILDQIV